VKIYTQAGELPFRLFTFPDGQQHFTLLSRDEFRVCVIETAIRNSSDLFNVLLAKDVLTQYGYVVSLDIRYLLGARMDRSIAVDQPFTLALVARILMGAGFARIRVLDPHSDVSTKLLGAKAVYPLDIIRTVIAGCGPDIMIVAPDAGATSRVDRLLESLGMRDSLGVVQGLKHRDSQTGRLTGFGVQGASRVSGRECLIVDDLCDGGGTFTGLAAELRKAGATKVSLYVTHGIFSKGSVLDGIDQVFTTDSYTQVSGVVCFPVSMSDCEEAR